MSAVIYARVSTETQEKNQTIESQLEELRQYADTHGLAVAREFVDDGYSGSLLERPALDALRAAVGAGGVDSVLCLCPDRLSRNFLHLGLLLEDFGKRGVRVIFSSQQIDYTPEGKLLLQIQGAVGEYERMKILDRSRRGRKHLARQGIMPANKTPYGYDYHGESAERWQVNEAKAEVVREVYRLFLEKGLTIRGAGPSAEQAGSGRGGPGDLPGRGAGGASRAGGGGGHPGVLRRCAAGPGGGDVRGKAESAEAGRRPDRGRP